MNDLERYYNKFNEEKRLDSRHGQIEFRTTWDVLHEVLAAKGLYPSKDIVIADIGAATGRYTLPLAVEGYHMIAVEPVKHNLGRLQKKVEEYEAAEGLRLSVEAYKGFAGKLKHLADNSCDAVLFLGPMYHLCEPSDKLLALSEAKRIAKPGAPIFVAYLMNEYGVLTFGIKEGHLLESLAAGTLSEDYKIRQDEDGLYSYVRLEDIASYNDAVGLERMKILTPDGPANYLRREVNALSEEAYEAFYRYHRSICERPDLLGAAAHTLDIVYKKI